MLKRRNAKMVKHPVPVDPTVIKTGANKGKKKQILVEDTVHGQMVDVDSGEEWYTFAFIMDLHEIGIVKDFEYQPQSLSLTPKYTYVPASLGAKKLKEKFLFHPHVYTADFKFTVFLDSQGVLDYFAQVFKIPQSSLREDEETHRTVADIWIDVKGEWMRQGEAFSVNQKFVFDKHGIVINKFIPKKAFSKLGCPKKAVQTPNGNPSKIFKGMKFISTVIKNFI